MLLWVDCRENDIMIISRIILNYIFENFRIYLLVNIVKSLMDYKVIVFCYVAPVSYCGIKVCLYFWYLLFGTIFL